MRTSTFWHATKPTARDQKDPAPDERARYGHLPMHMFSLRLSPSVTFSPAGLAIYINSYHFRNICVLRSIDLCSHQWSNSCLFQFKLTVFYPPSFFLTAFSTSGFTVEWITTWG